MRLKEIVLYYSPVLGIPLLAPHTVCNGLHTLKWALFLLTNYHHFLHTFYYFMLLKEHFILFLSSQLISIPTQSLGKQIGIKTSIEAFKPLLQHDPLLHLWHFKPFFALTSIPWLYSTLFASAGECSVVLGVMLQSAVLSRLSDGEMCHNALLKLNGVQ